MKTALSTFSALLVLATLSACGGGGSTPPAPAVSVSPATANVQEGGAQQFTANVTNTTSTAVNWQVNGVAGGNSTVGTVSSTGLYTAPTAIPSPASVTVTAALQAAPSISGNAIVTVTAVQFTNATLKGNYIFSVSGIDANLNVFYEVGEATLDGNGNVTGGEADLNDVGLGYVMATSVTGTYSVGPDGRGTLNLSIPAISSNTFSYAFAIRALTNAVLNEIDNNVVNATGTLEAQSSGVMPQVAAPSGNYAFGFSGVAAACGNLGVNSVGIFALSGTTVGGLQDVNCDGNITQAQTLSGSYTAIDGVGRGSGSFSGNSGSADFIYYVVSPNRFRFMCPDSGIFFLGSANLQTQSTFGNADFAGNYVVSTSAGTQAGVSNTLIQFNASGGNVSTGYYDVNDTGTVGQASLTGSYSLAANGRVNGTFNVNGAGLPFVMYLVSPTQAYYLDDRTNAVGGGNVYAQSPAVTSNAAWAGSYATKQLGYFVVAGVIQAANSTSISGQLSADGNGNLAGTLDINDPINVYAGLTLQGTYSVGTVAPGRTTASITTSEGTRNYVMYVVGPTQVVMMENDTNLTAGGDAVLQF